MTTAINYGDSDPPNLNHHKEFENLLLPTLNQRPLVLTETQQDVGNETSGQPESQLSPSSLVTADESIPSELMDEKTSPVNLPTQTAAVAANSVPGVSKVKSSSHRNKMADLDKELFTFKPKLNRKSTLIAQNILGFYERQNRHCQKQLELVCRIEALL